MKWETAVNNTKILDRESNLEVTVFSLLQIYAFLYSVLKARFLLNHQSFLQDMTSSFSSRLPFSTSFFFAFSKTNRSLH